MIHALAQVETLFTTPALAAMGAAAVSVPIAIHLLSRLRRRRQPWGAMRFLLAAIQAHRRRLRFEQLLLLALRCLLVALLGVALAGPVLTGCAKERGRTVYLLLDDSLASRAEATGGSTRFDQLKETAGELIAALLPGDRVVIWRVGRPAEPVTRQPVAEPAAAIRIVESLEPRYGRSDIAAAIEAVTDQLDAQDARPRDAVVVLLSDLSVGVASPSGGLAEADVLQRLARRAELLVTRPMAGRSNVQIARLEPRRAMTVAEDAERATVAVTLEAMRFGDVSRSATAESTIELLDHRNRPVAAAQRRLSWPAGQRRAAINVDLTIEEAGGPRRDRSLVVRGRLQADESFDALREDDAAFAVVSVRRQLRVAVIAEAGDGGGGLTAARWLTLALAPTDNGPIALRRVLPSNVDALEEMDAAFVLRPDSLGESAWEALGGFARRGGLVWVWPAAEGSDWSWAGAMSRAFGLSDWSIAWEPAASEEGWSVGAASTPAPLRLLGADYDVLLRPVRVWRRLAVETPRDEVWITIEQGGEALVASKRVGLGQLVFSAAALDAEWTNLPAKPLFVPLLHETLRGVLGAQRGRVTQAVAGSQPELGRAFAGAQTLAPVLEQSEPIELRHREERTQPAEALQRPGVYVAASDPSLKLAVNVDAQGGDLSATEEQRLAQWLAPVEGWRLIDRSDAAAALAQPVKVAMLGWPLLWAVLGLLILETLLARWLSHAQAPPASSLSHRLMARLAALRHETLERKRAA